MNEILIPTKPVRMPAHRKDGRGNGRAIEQRMVDASVCAMSMKVYPTKSQNVT